MESPPPVTFGDHLTLLWREIGELSGRLDALEDRQKGQSPAADRLSRLADEGYPGGDVSAPQTAASAPEPAPELFPPVEPSKAPDAVRIIGAALVTPLDEFGKLTGQAYYFDNAELTVMKRRTP